MRLPEAMRLAPEVSCMITPILASVLAVLLSAPAHPICVAAQGSEADVRQIAVAKYVALGYDLGDRWASEFDIDVNRKITQDDRQALRDLRKRFEQWPRYVLVDRPQDADIRVGVRIGKHLTLEGTTRPGAGPPVGSVAPSAGVEVSAPHDMLTVRDRSGALLWREQLSGGFSSREGPLFTSLRSAVEAASKHP